MTKLGGGGGLRMLQSGGFSVKGVNVLGGAEDPGGHYALVGKDATFS